MAITPHEDKKAIKAILDTDEYLLSAGFLPDMIKTTKAGSEVLNDNNSALQIFISSGTPESATSDIVRNMVYNIRVAGKMNNSGRIDNAANQIIALLHNRDIGRSHILYLLDPPLELESNAAVYVIEITFLCQATVFNKIKTQ